MNGIILMPQENAPDFVAGAFSYRILPENIFLPCGLLSTGIASIGFCRTKSVKSTPLPGVDSSQGKYSPEYPFVYVGGKRTNNSKTARLEMRIQPGDKDKIVKAAKRSGISVAEYVLRCCKGHPPKEKPPEEFWNLLNELYTVFDELPPEKQEKLARLILRLQEVL